MKNFFENITNEELDLLNMDRYSIIDNEEYQNYYKEKSSKEHYRLLTLLSNKFDNEIFVDVGTLKGCSVLALSTNKNNKVYSFNLHNEFQLKENIDNVEFIIDDITNGKYDNILTSSKVILLDTFHDGGFERKFLEYLNKINYKGVLILDDIFLNQNMIDFWNEINIEKLDITNIGHITGTGVVFLN
jgi:hypothetical protein